MIKMTTRSRWSNIKLSLLYGSTCTLDVYTTVLQQLCRTSYITLWLVSNHRPVVIMRKHGQPNSNHGTLRVRCHCQIIEQDMMKKIHSEHLSSILKNSEIEKHIPEAVRNRSNRNLGLLNGYNCIDWRHGTVYSGGNNGQLS